MSRFWREHTKTMLLVYLLLGVLAGAYVHAYGNDFNGGHGIQMGPMSVGAANQGFQLPGFVIDAFLTWRVLRGGSISWVLLLFLNTLIAVVFVVAVAIAGGSLYMTGLLAFNLAILAAITSPAARRRLGATSLR